MEICRVLFPMDPQTEEDQVSNEAKTGCLGYIGDDIVPSYLGIMINLHKDPYWPTSIRMEIP